MKYRLIKYTVRVSARRDPVTLSDHRLGGPAAVQLIREAGEHKFATGAPWASG